MTVWMSSLPVCILYSSTYDCLDKCSYILQNSNFLVDIYKRAHLLHRRTSCNLQTSSSKINLTYNFQCGGEEGVTQCKCSINCRPTWDCAELAHFFCRESVRSNCGAFLSRLDIEYCTIKGHICVQSHLARVQVCLQIIYSI